MTDDVKELIAEADEYDDALVGGEDENWFALVDLVRRMRVALEAATIAPAVDREALVEWFKWHADPNDVADALIASGIFRDVRDVQAETLEQAADALYEKAGPQPINSDRDYDHDVWHTYRAAGNELRDQAQAIREARNA